MLPLLTDYVGYQMRISADGEKKAGTDWTPASCMVECVKQVHTNAKYEQSTNSSFRASAPGAGKTNAKLPWSILISA